MPGLEGTTLGRYHLLRRLGRGGMSEVYLAHDELMDREVAVKVVNSNHADYVERFRREVQAIANLSHKHILPAFDTGEHDYWYYLVMPYIEQGTLRDRLEQGPLTLEEAGEILQQVASALQFAHDHGIIHRDIKASNILLRDDHYAYLADFGLVKTLKGASELTQTGSLLGTPEYMAPELAEGPASTSSDIYALGVLLYQMVTGRVPFTGETPLAVYWKQMREQPIPPSRLNPAIPRAVEEVILRALDKDPRRRFKTAQALAYAYMQALTVPDSNETEVMPPLEEKVIPSSPSSPAQVQKQPGKLILPGYPEIPLKGILRAEIPAYLSQELKKYIRDPQVHAQTMIRLSIFGAVSKPGFYQVPADQLAGDAIMTAAGGPAGGADPHKTTVRRGGVEIWSKEAFQQALVEGVTLDRLNLRAGDEITVGEQRHTNVRNYLYFVTGLSSLYFLLSRVF